MKKIVLIMMVIAAAVALPAMAQQQEWKSTSVMQTSGSAYSPQVQQVGSVAAPQMATTTEGYSPANAPVGPRKAFDIGGETGQSDESPLGDALLPLLLMAAAFGGYVAVRHRRSAKI